MKRKIEIKEKKKGDVEGDNMLRRMEGKEKPCNEPCLEWLL